MDESLLKSTIKNANSGKNHSSDIDGTSSNSLLSTEELNLLRESQLRESQLQRFGTNSSLSHHLSGHVSSSSNSFHHNDLRNSIHLPSVSSSTITSAGSEDLQLLFSNYNNNNGGSMFLEKPGSKRTQFVHSLSNASMRSKQQQLSQILSPDSGTSGSTLQSPSSLSSASLMLSNQPLVQANALSSLPPSLLHHSYSTSNVLNLSHNILKAQQQQQQQTRSSSNSSSLMLHHLNSAVPPSSDYEEYSLIHLQKPHHLPNINGTLPANFRGRSNYGLVGSSNESRGDYESLCRK